MEKEIELTVSQSTAERITSEAAKQGVSTDVVIRDLLQKYIKTAGSILRFAAKNGQKK